MEEKEKPKGAIFRFVRSAFNPDLKDAINSYREQRRPFINQIAALFIYHKLIPKDHPAVNPDNPAPVARIAWEAWQLLELRPRNWWRIVVFASFAVPWLLFWLSVIAMILVFLHSHTAASHRQGDKSTAEASSPLGNAPLK
jgi:hypothetical protein